MRKVMCGILSLLLISVVAFAANAQAKPDAKVQELLAKGNALIWNGQLNEAIATLGEAVKLNPQSPETHQQLGRAYASKFFKTRDAQLETKARAELRQSLKLDPSFAEAYMSLGRIDAFKKHYAEAGANYEQAIKADPTLIRAYGEKWRTRLNRADFEIEIPAIRAEVESLLKRTENREVMLAAAALGYEIIGDETNLLYIQDKLIAEFPKSGRAEETQLDRIYHEKDQRKQVQMAEAFIARYPQTRSIGTLRQIIFMNRVAQKDVSDEELTRIGEALIKTAGGDPQATIGSYPYVIVAFAERRLALDRTKEWADEMVKLFEDLKPNSPIMDKYPPVMRDEMLNYGKLQAHKARGYALIKLGQTEEAAKELKAEFDPVIKAVEKDGYVFWQDMDLRNLGARPRVLWLAELYELEGDYARAARYLLAGYGGDEHANQFIQERLPVVYKKLNRSDSDATVALNASKARYLSMKDSLAASNEGTKEGLLAKRLGTPAPDFKAMKLDKKEIRLSDLKGKVAVVNFWATWCGPCVAEMPHFQKVFDKYKTQGDVVFLAISVDENKPVVRPFLEKNHFTMPVAYDDEASKAFKIEGVPSTFIIDRNGVIQFSDLGFGDDDLYVDRLVWRIEALLKDTAATPSSETAKERKND